MSSEPFVQTGDNYVFGEFRLDSRQGQLFRRGEVVPLTPKVLDTLFVLVRNAGLVISREELIERVWPDTIVTDTSLSQNIWVLRKALGEDEGTSYIETVPRRGYRFNGQVDRAPASVPAIRDSRPRRRLSVPPANAPTYSPDEISARFFIRKDRKTRLRMALAVAGGVLLGVCLTAILFMAAGDESSREVREWIADRVRMGPKNFSGTWDGSQGAWGVMRLHQVGNKVTGTYDCCGEGSSIEGTVTGNRLEFRWQNGANHRGGVGYMVLLYPDFIEGDYCCLCDKNPCEYKPDDGLILRLVRK